jgi:hypothetical protein
MNIYVVMLEDPFATHFIGVYATKEAAQRYVEMQDIEEIDGEQYTISEVSVQNWFVKASDQVQTLVQLLPLTESGQLNIMAITDILATYATEELEELLQFVETKEGRFQKLKRELKEELAIRADVELWSQPAC